MEKTISCKTSTSTDQKYFALLHYLRVPQGTGTAFYRQRSTGIECVTDRKTKTPATAQVAEIMERERLPVLRASDTMRQAIVLLAERRGIAISIRSTSC